MNKKIILLGYTNNSHTNWYPWNRFKKTFDELNLESQWVEVANFKREIGKSYIFICWNLPDVLDLISMELLTKDDIVFQKVTSMTKRDATVTWGDDPDLFHKNWTWPAYKMCLDVLEMGYNLYAFGCKTSYENFPVKKKLIEKLGNRMIMIPWSTCMFSHEELQQQSPIATEGEFDCAFVGSIWGRKGRGNLESVRDYLMPILKSTNRVYLAGAGTPVGPISNEKHVEIIKNSNLCPIINAPSWRSEKGVQDRFWTVFASGRFGVVDSEGVFDFFDRDEVVCETNSQEYIEKSLYYMKNIDKQVPFITKIQKRIKEEYNWNKNFKKMFGVLK